MRSKLLTIAIILACISAGAVPGIIGAQIGPTPNGPIDYGPSITTDFNKLCACYSLIQQTIDEYNRQSWIVVANPAKYADKFRVYTREYYDELLRSLIGERNRLMESIRSEAYNDEEWRELLSDGNITALAVIFEELYGVRSDYKETPTLASCSELDAVKQIDLDDIWTSPDVDPIEDLTTYTEYDEGSDMTVTSSRATLTSAESGSDTYYLYFDKGTAFFDGDFSHRCETLVSAIGNNGQMNFWIVANSPDVDEQDLRDANESHLWSAQYRSGASPWPFFLEENDSGSRTYDLDYSYDLDTVYYHTIERDEDIGTYGTLYDYICTGNYYGESGSSLEWTLSVTLHTSKKDFRYIYAMSSQDQGVTTRTVSGYNQNLDLGVVVGIVSWSFGYIIGG